MQFLPRPPGVLTPNAVTVTRVATGGRDAAAGRTADPAPDPVVYRVAVQPTSAEDVPEHRREQGVVYLTVKAYDDLGARLRDELLDERGRALVVKGGRATSGGAGRTWLYDCEYRPPPGK